MRDKNERPSRSTKPKRAKFDPSLRWIPAAFIEDCPLTDPQAEEVARLLSSGNFRSAIEAAIRTSKVIEQFEAEKPTRGQFHKLLREYVKFAEPLVPILDAIELRADARMALGLSSDDVKNLIRILPSSLAQAKVVAAAIPSKGDHEMIASEQLISSLATVWEEAYGTPPRRTYPRKGDDYHFGEFHDFVAAVAGYADINVSPARVRDFLAALHHQTT